MKFIGECVNKGQHIRIERDTNGKFFIDVDDRETQKRLNAEETVRWLLTAMHTENHSSVHTMPDEELAKRTNEIYKVQGIISAIKFCRTHREWGLKEAKDYVEGLHLR